MKNKLRLPLLALLILTNTFVPDYALGLMNKGSDIYFFLGLILIIFYFAVIVGAIVMIVSDIKEFLRERKKDSEETNSNQSNNQTNDNE